MARIEMKHITITVSHVQCGGSIPAVASAIPAEVEVKQAFGVIAVANEGMAASSRVIGSIQDWATQVEFLFKQGFPLSGRVAAGPPAVAFLRMGRRTVAKVLHGCQLAEGIGTAAFRAVTHIHCLAAVARKFSYLLGLLIGIGVLNEFAQVPIPVAVGRKHQAVIKRC